MGNPEPPKNRRPREESMVKLRSVTDLDGWSNPHTGADPLDISRYVEMSGLNT